MKKKVLIDFEKLKYPNCGLGQVAINFGKQVAKFKEEQIEWVYLTHSAASHEQFNAPHIHCRKISFLTKKGILPIDAGVDLFHLTHQMPSYGASKARLNIFTIHDLNFLYEKTERKGRVYLKHVQKSIDRANIITCISNFTASEVRNNLVVPEQTRIEVIYNGVETPDKNIAIKPDFLPDGEFLFTIGAVVKKKNFHVLVDMLSYLPNLNLIIAGSTKGEYADFVNEHIKEHGLTDRIFLPGEISEEAKAYLYHNCKAFLFPTMLEGFGLPIVEAMRCGKPTFASNLTSLPEIGGDHAYYWDRFDGEYMAQVYKEGMTDFENNKESRVADLIAHGNSFTWENNAKQYLALYKELLGLA